MAIGRWLLRTQTALFLIWAAAFGLQQVIAVHHEFQHHAQLAQAPAQAHQIKTAESCGLCDLQHSPVLKAAFRAPLVERLPIALTNLTASSDEILSPVSSRPPVRGPPHS